MVRPRRLELPCLAALPPQGSASTNFATAAYRKTLANLPAFGKAALIANLKGHGKW